jgi:hypothetical protein
MLSGTRPAIRPGCPIPPDLAVWPILLYRKCDLSCPTSVVLGANDPDFYVGQAISRNMRGLPTELRKKAEVRLVSWNLLSLGQDLEKDHRFE